MSEVPPNSDGAVTPPTVYRVAEDRLPAPLRRFVPLLGVIGLSLSLVGFLTGIRERADPPRRATPLPTPSGPAPPAVAYADLPTASIRPNGTGKQLLSEYRYDRPGIFDAVVRTEQMRQAALVDRSRNRAYDGAPPTIPHPAEAQSAVSCLACHSEGLKVGDRVASRISHAQLSNCTQCHVEERRSGLAFAGDAAENTFTGVYRAGPGDRASPGAPPTIPHHTWMREHCTSCHGLVTRPGTRTTHPWLSSCTQCHVASGTSPPLPFAREEQ